MKRKEAKQVINFFKRLFELAKQRDPNMVNAQYYIDAFTEASEALDTKWKKIDLDHFNPDDLGLEDHNWYLIAHENFVTPMKAKYHDAPEFMFEFLAADGNPAKPKTHYTYIYDGSVTHVMPLPNKPKQSEEI